MWCILHRITVDNTFLVSPKASYSTISNNYYKFHDVIYCLTLALFSCRSKFNSSKMVASKGFQTVRFDSVGDLKLFLFQLPIISISASSIIMIIDVCCGLPRTWGTRVSHDPLFARCSVCQYTPRAIKRTTTKVKEKW